MHRLIIHNLGPVKHCELTCSHFMTFTGFQASGKSTVAKAIFYFRTIKDDICAIAEEKALEKLSLDAQAPQVRLKTRLISNLREKFLRVFGSSWGMDNDMYLEYHYTNQCAVRVSLKEERLYPAPNYVWIDLSPELLAFLEREDDALVATSLGVPEQKKQLLQSKVNSFFADSCEVVYIPAGRSMLTLLSQQLSYIYTTMKDAQKRTIDYCTQDYIERILSIKPEFSNGLAGIMAYQGARSNVSKSMIDLAFELIQKVLRGSYSFNDGEERITVSKNRYVKINFASSGQQESVWILNLLFYYFVKGDPVLFIIEEPESHLFPESQKFITELIALVSNSNHSVVLTTHSPYVLGTLNNLLYAGQISPNVREKASHIIPEPLWIAYNSFAAWFVQEGGVEDCIDKETCLIQNERIDGISKVINQDFDGLFDLQIQADE